MSKKIIISEDWTFITKSKQTVADVVQRELSVKGTFTIPEIGTFTVLNKPGRKHFDGLNKRFVKLPARKVVKFSIASGFHNRFKK